MYIVVYITEATIHPLVLTFVLASLSISGGGVIFLKQKPTCVWYSQSSPSLFQLLQYNSVSPWI